MLFCGEEGEGCMRSLVCGCHIVCESFYCVYLNLTTLFYVAELV